MWRVCSANTEGRDVEQAQPVYVAAELTRAGMRSTTARAAVNLEPTTQNAIADAAGPRSCRVGA